MGDNKKPGNDRGLCVDDWCACDASIGYLRPFTDRISSFCPVCGLGARRDSSDSDYDWRLPLRRDLRQRFKEMCRKNNTGLGAAIDCFHLRPGDEVPPWTIDGTRDKFEEIGWIQQKKPGQYDLTLRGFLFS